MMKIDCLFYALCAWAGLSMAFFYALVLGRSPSYLEVFVMGFFFQRYIDTVTIPFLEENRIMLPGFGYLQIAGPRSGSEGGTSKSKVIRQKVA